MTILSSAIERRMRHGGDYRRHRPGRLVATAAMMERARLAYAIGARRQSALGKGLFADPAWNILLDLFLSDEGGRDLSVTAVCIGSRSSSATALRYITLLVERGLIDRVADEHDGRRTYVRLTAKGWNAMVTLFEDEPAAD
ncbi:winged helix DNA-binding protein [uncultured Sphingomonas sp.]|uniref:winged helix DNA-binding protein n=1 Tax=uncultured Sphingomonas sp. TaxID=158754 RepID=UPI0035CB85AB